MDNDGEAQGAPRSVRKLLRFFLQHWHLLLRVPDTFLGFCGPRTLHQYIHSVQLHHKSTLLMLELSIFSVLPIILLPKHSMGNSRVLLLLHLLHGGSRGGLLWCDLHSSALFSESFCDRCQVRQLWEEELGEGEILKNPIEGDFL